MAVGLFLLPAERVAPLLPEGLPAVRVLGRCLVAVGWADYAPSAPGEGLAYRERLVATLVRRGGRLRARIPRIWVDSAASIAGARAMWGIPTGIAAFEGFGEPMAPRAVGRDGARAASTAWEGVGPPIPAALGLGVRQRDGAGRWIETRCRMRGVARLGRRVSLDIGAASPLAALFGAGAARPRLALVVRALSVRFG